MVINKRKDGEKLKELDEERGRETKEREGAKPKESDGEKGRKTRGRERWKESIRVK